MGVQTCALPICCQTGRQRGEGRRARNQRDPAEAAPLGEDYQPGAQRTPPEPRALAGLAEGHRLDEAIAHRETGHGAGDGEQRTAQRTAVVGKRGDAARWEEHTSELQSLMCTLYADF